MRNAVTRLCAGAFVASALTAIFVVFMWGYANGQDNCRGFIEQSCCCTNSCCWEIRASDLEPLAGNRWRVKATGQVVPQKDFSPDGKYYRCACDYDHATQKWNRHQGANTRCIYVPFQGS